MIYDLDAINSFMHGLLTEEAFIAKTQATEGEIQEMIGDLSYECFKQSYRVTNKA